MPKLIPTTSQTRRRQRNRPFSPSPSDTGHSSRQHQFRTFNPRWGPTAMHRACSARGWVALTTGTWIESCGASQITESSALRFAFGALASHVQYELKGGSHRSSEPGSLSNTDDSNGRSGWFCAGGASTWAVFAGCMVVSGGTASCGWCAGHKSNERGKSECWYRVEQRSLRLSLRYHTVRASPRRTIQPLSWALCRPSVMWVDVRLGRTNLWKNGRSVNGKGGAPCTES